MGPGCFRKCVLKAGPLSRNAYATQSQPVQSGCRSALRPIKKVFKIMAHPTVESRTRSRFCQVVRLWWAEALLLIGLMPKEPWIISSVLYVWGTSPSPSSVKKAMKESRLTSCDVAVGVPNLLDHWPAIERFEFVCSVAEGPLSSVWDDTTLASNIASGRIASCLCNCAGGSGRLGEPGRGYRWGAPPKEPKWFSGRQCRAKADTNGDSKGTSFSSLRAWER